MSVTAAAPPLERLKGILAEIADIRHAESIIDWDSRVSMPHAGAQARADVSATLTRLTHERFVSDEVGELLGELGSPGDEGVDSVEAALVRSIGLFGYFPTYQLGNVLSVQIWDRARADIGDVEEQFARGEFAPLREWLREHIYRHGGRYPPRDLLRQVTGSDLDPEPYLEYLRTKFA